MNRMFRQPIRRQHPARGRMVSVIGGATLVLALLFLSGCAANAPAATATPTKTQVPTFTPAPPTATETEAPPTATDTPLPTPTEVPTEAPTATPEPTATPAPPTATPRPAAPRPTARPVQPTAAPPPAAADPCASIGGDGCKWRVAGGPSTADNGGQELKMQLLFIHGGRNETQGSYFVWLEKDGVKLPIPDSVRSVAKASSPGTLGAYNYEYILGLGQLPGNIVSGNYTLWVLDGNGERDSRNITFSIPANQGLLWIRFDQS